MKQSLIESSVPRGNLRGGVGGGRMDGRKMQTAALSHKMEGLAGKYRGNTEDSIGSWLRLGMGRIETSEMESHGNHGRLLVNFKSYRCNSSWEGGRGDGGRRFMV